MPSEETQKLLDGIDRRLALGEIDLDTYKMLRNKFLSQDKGYDPLGNTVSSLSREVQKINCPNCGAPVDRKDEASTLVICDYCGVQYVLKTAQEEMDRLRADLLSWISEMSGSSAVIDEASRRFIFNEKVFPRIEMEVRRTIEPFDIATHNALLNVPIARLVEDSPFNLTCRSLPHFEDHRLQLTEILARVQSSEVQQYAVNPVDRSRIRTIEIKSREVIHLQNIRNLLKNYDDRSPAMVRRNLDALIELYESSAKDLEEGDPSSYGYYMALKRRMKGTSDAMAILEKLTRGGHGDDLSGHMEELKGCIIELEGASADVEKSGKDLMDIVPATEGIRADIRTMRVLLYTYDLFRKGTGYGAADFKTFVSEVETLAREHLRAGSGLDIMEYLGLLNKHIDSVQFNGPANVCKDHGWEKGVVQTNVRSSFFGGTERATVQKRLLLPFWVSMLFFSKQKGLIFKNGYPDQGCLLVPAFDPRVPVKRIENESRMFSQIQGAIEHPSDLGSSIESLSPVVDENMAIKRMKGYQMQVPKLGSSYIKIMGLVYLPASFVKYSSKKDRVMVLTADKDVSFHPFGISERRIGQMKLNVVG